MTNDLEKCSKLLTGATLPYDPNVEKLMELLDDRSVYLKEERSRKWYKRAVLKFAYEAIKARGYEHEFDEIKRMLPDLIMVPDEKMDLYCEKGTIAAYMSLFNEIWHGQEIPSPFILGAEIGSHVLDNYLNKGRTVKRNPLEREAAEWVEKMIELYLMKQLGNRKLKRSSLSDKEIENIQIVMRFGPQDPHAGYYEAGLELLEKMSAKERREFLSPDGYREWILQNAKTRKKRFFTALNMFNVMAETYRLGEQKRNIKDMIALLTPTIESRSRK